MSGPKYTNINLNPTGKQTTKTIKPAYVPLDLNATPDANSEFKMLPTLDDNRQKSYVDPTKYSPYIKTGVMDNELLDIARARAQGTGEKFLGFLNQSILGEIIGGSIGAIGATLDIPDAIYSKITGGNVDFSNWMTGLGDKIRETSEEMTPIYELNPNKSFQFGDWGWWFNRGKSVVSTISMLVPALATTKGLSMLGKAGEMLAATSKLKGTALGKVLGAPNKIAGDARELAKLGVNATVMRNAENMKEAFTTYQEGYSTAQEAFKDDAKYEEFLQTEQGKEFAANHDTSDREMAAQFLASKAGWKTYQVNSANIVFDLIQASALMKPIFTGAHATTRGARRNAALTNVIKPTNNSAIKAWRNTSPFLGAIMRQSTEGIEEMVNHIGGKEGSHYIKTILEGDDGTDFADRLVEYSKDPAMWESGMWGVAGGMVFEGVGKLMKGDSDTKLNSALLQQAATRKTQLSDHAKFIANTQNLVDANKLTQDEANRKIGQAKAALASEMTLNAIATQSVDALLDQLDNGDFAEAVRASMPKDEAKEMGDTAVQKAVENLKNDILQTERIYKEAAKNVESRDIPEDVKFRLATNQTTRQFQIEKFHAANKEISAKIANIQNTDVKYKDNLTSASDIYLDLKAAEDYLKDQQEALDAFNKGQIKEQFDKKTVEHSIKELPAAIQKLKDQLTELESSGVGSGLVNRELDAVNKDAHTLRKESWNNKYTIDLQQKELSHLKTEAGAKEYAAKVEEIKTKVEEIDKANKFKTYTDSIDKTISAGTIDAAITELESELKIQTGVEEKKYVQKKLKELKDKKDFLAKTQVEEETETVNDTKETEGEIPQTPETKPTIQVTDEQVKKELGAALFGALEKAINKILTSGDSKEKITKDLEARKNGIKLKDKPLAQAYIQAKIDAVNQVSNDTQLTEYQGIKVGNIYTLKGVTYEVIKIVDNGTEVKIIAIKDGTGSSSLKAAQVLDKLSTGEMKLLNTETTTQIDTDILVKHLEGMQSLPNDADYHLFNFINNLANKLGVQVPAEILELINLIDDTYGVSFRVSTATTALGTSPASFSPQANRITLFIGDIKGLNLDSDFLFREIIGHELVHALLGNKYPYNTAERTAFENWLKGKITANKDLLTSNASERTFTNANQQIILPKGTSIFGGKFADGKTSFLNSELNIPFGTKVTVFTDGKTITGVYESTGMIREDKTNLPWGVAGILMSTNSWIKAQEPNIFTPILEGNPEELLTYALTNPKVWEQLPIELQTVIEDFVENIMPELEGLLEIVKTAQYQEQNPTNETQENTELPVKITDPARLRAKEYNLDLDAIEGTGKNGTITLTDVQNFIKANNITLLDEIPTESLTSNNEVAEGSNNIFLSFLDLGIKDGVVDVEHYKDQVRKRGWRVPDITQEELEEAIIATTTGEINTGSTLEIVPSDGGAIAIKTRKGITIGWLNDINNLREEYKYALALSKMTMAELSTEKKKYEKSFTWHTPLIKWRMSEFYPNNTNKPFATKLETLKNQGVSAKAIIETIKNTLARDPNAKFYTQVTRKTSGNLLQDDKQESLANVFPELDEIFTAPSTTQAGHKSSILVSSKDSTIEFQRISANDYMNHDQEYNAGTVYIMIPGANAIEGNISTYIPVPCSVNNVNEETANKITDLIGKLANVMMELHASKTDSFNILVNERVSALRNEIDAYINVTKANSTNKEYFKVYSDKIEFSYGDGLVASIYFKNAQKESVINLVLTDPSQKDASGRDLVIKQPNFKGAEVGALNAMTDGNKPVFRAKLNELLQTKRHNVNFKKLKSDEEYRKHLFKNVITTDVKTVKTPDGKDLKNGKNRVPSVTSKGAKKDKNSSLVLSISSKLGVKSSVLASNTSTQKQGQETKVNEPKPSQTATKVELADADMQVVADALFKDGTIVLSSKKEADDLKKAVRKQLAPGEVIDIDGKDGVNFIVSIISNNSGIARTKVASGVVQTDEVINVENAKEWWAKTFGENVELDMNVAGILLINGVEAWGVFQNAMAKISISAKQGTEYHEAFHVVFWLYHNEEQRAALLEEARDRYGNIGNVALEENLADEFMEYMLKGGKTSRVEKGSKTEGFFTKIYNWIKSFFSKPIPKSLTEDLYDKIDSGTFNYKPDEALVNYAKRMTRTKVVEGFTRKEEEETIGLLAFKFLKYQETNSELKIKDVKDNATLSPKEAIRLSLLEDQNFVDDRAYENIDRVLAIYDKFYDKTIEYVNRQFGITVDENLDILEAQGIDKKWDDTAIFGTSQKDSISNYIKQVIMTSPKYQESSYLDENNNVVGETYKETFLGLEKFLDFNKVYPYIMRNMLGASDINEMLARLENLATHDRSILGVLSKLKNDTNLQSAWLSQFRKQSPTKYIVLIDDNGVKVDISNKNTSHYILSNGWKNNVITGLEDKTITPAVLAEIKTIMNGELAALTLTEETTVNNIQRISEISTDIMNRLGIDVTQEMLFKTLTNPIYINYLGSVKNSFVRLIREPMTAVTQELGTELKLTEAEIKKRDKPFAFNSHGRLNLLAQHVNLYQYDLLESSSFDVMGNNVYSVINPSFLSLTIDKIKAATNAGQVNKEEAKEELLQWLKEFAQDPAMKYSNWLWASEGNNGFLKMTEDIHPVTGKVIFSKDANKLTVANLNMDFLNRFEYGALDGLKDVTANKGEQYGTMSDTSWKFTQLAMYLSNAENKNEVKIPLAVHTDTGNAWFITSHRYTGISGGKVARTTALYDAVRKTVYQEMNRMKAARDLLFVYNNETGVYIPKQHMNSNDPRMSGNEDIYVDYTKLQKGYHYTKVDKSGMPILFDGGKPTGDVFKFHGIKAVNKVSGQFQNGIWSLDKYNKETQATLNEEINKAVDKFIAGQIKDGVRLFGDKKNGAGQVTTKGVESLIKNQSEFSRYDSFEDFIGEFMLNSFISQTEQFNFFVGVVPEFKRDTNGNIAKDPNKRSKQVLAPGIPLSGINSGPTFKAATLADIKLPSVIYEDIANSVAESLKNTNPAYRKMKLEMKEIFNFNADYSKMNALSKAVHNIVKGYLKTNIGDAQGYITLKRYENIIKDLGRWNPTFESLMAKVRAGNKLSTGELSLLLQPIKGYYYGRDFDNYTGKHISNQIKYSTVPLIPQLIEGTEGKKLLDWMNQNNLQEVFFESAEKVGTKHIINLTDSEGRIIDEQLQKYSSAAEVPYTFREYKNTNWRLQLDVPDHILDEENKLGTQIAKIIISNLPENETYYVNNSKGKSALSKKQLIDNYFGLMSYNIQEDAEKLLDRLKVVKEDGKYIIKDKQAIKDILEGEIIKRGISDNYRDAIELIEVRKGVYEFNLPLFINNMSNKWESILTSLFTNNVTDQKLPGGTAVLLSGAFITNSLGNVEPTVDTLKESQIATINWHKDIVDRNDFKLRMTNLTPDGSIVEAEAILPAWSRQFFIETVAEDGTITYELDDINNIPEELRQQVWYRIPYEAKYSTVLVKVVGFLPSANGSTIILPDEIVTSTGADFDVDKKFGAIPTFKVVKNEDGTRSYVKNHYVEEDGIEGNSREARDNRIIDIWRGILSNPKHYAESMSPQSFEDGANVIKEINEMLEEETGEVNPHTVEGQLYFRKQNIAGRALKGMAADSNAFLSVAQVAKMKLGNSETFHVSYRTKPLTEEELAYNTKMEEDGTIDRSYKVYDAVELVKKYGRDNVSVYDDNAVVRHNKFAWNADGTFTNVDNNATTVHASQILAMILDIVKEGIPANINTYTFYPYITMLNTGINVRYASMFIRQPILVKLAETYLRNQGVTGDSSGKEIEDVKREFQTALFKRLIKDEEYNKRMTKLKSRGYYFAMEAIKEGKKVNISARDAEEVFDYDATGTTNYAWSVDELKDMLISSNNVTKKKATEDSNSEVEALRDQLKILEMYKRYKKSGEAYQDIMKALKMDTLGAGPSLSTTDSLNHYIDHAANYTVFEKYEDTKEFKDATKEQKENLRKAMPKYVKTQKGARIFINVNGEDIPAVHAILPEMHGMHHDSAYSVLQAYKKYANDLSYEILNKEFIQYSPAFKRFESKVLTGLGVLRNEDVSEALHKFLNTIIYSKNSFLAQTESEQILGIENKVQSKAKDWKDMSAANKLAFIQAKYKDVLANDSHILNYLQAKTTAKDFTRNGFQSIDFINTKTDNLTDGRLEDSFVELWNGQLGNIKDKRFKDLAKDLLRYNFVTSGFHMQKNSFSKIIPTEIMVEIGMRDYLNNLKLQMENPNYFDATYPGLVDSFMQSNWYNRELVPKVYTKLDKNGEIGEKDINWQPNANNGLITVSNALLDNADYNIQKATYVLVPFFKTVKDENNRNRRELVKEVLYKKHSNNALSTFYYPVNKKGNRGFNEFTDTSLIADNNVPFAPRDYQLSIETGLDYTGKDTNKHHVAYSRINMGEEVKQLYKKADAVIVESPTEQFKMKKLAESFKEDTNRAVYYANELVFVTGEIKDPGNNYVDLKAIMTKGNTFLGKYAQVFDALRAGSTIGVRVTKEREMDFIGDRIVNEVLEHYVQKGALQKTVQDGINYYVKETKDLKTVTENYNGLNDSESETVDNNCK